MLRSWVGLARCSNAYPRPRASVSLYILDGQTVRPNASPIPTQPKGSGRCGPDQFRGALRLSLSPNPQKGCDREGETGGKRGAIEITGLDTDRFGLLPGVAITDRGCLTARSASGRDRRPADSRRHTWLDLRGPARRLSNLGDGPDGNVAVRKGVAMPAIRPGRC